MTTEERLQAMFAEHLGIDSEEVTAHSSLRDLGADSLDQAEIAIAIEEEFNLDLLGEIDADTPFHDLVDQIEERLGRWP